MSDKNSDLSLCAGHRERLRQNFLDDKLAKYETLELLLSYAIPRRDVRPLARMLYNKFGGMYPILSASIDDLCRIRGMGRNTAIFIKVVQKILLDGYEHKFKDSQVLHDREQLANFCKLQLGNKYVEEVRILYLDDMGRLLENQLHSTGTYDRSSLYDVEIVKYALSLGAKGVVLVHNHPRPDTSFSDQDIQITLRLKNMLNAVGINLIDHYLVSGDMLYTMSEFHIYTNGIHHTNGDTGTPNKS